MRAFSQAAQVEVLKLVLGIRKGEIHGNIERLEHLPDREMERRSFDT